MRSRKEKPTRTALREMKIGTGGDPAIGVFIIGLALITLIMIIVAIIG